ncbi:DUF5677 domain-containing protein [Burkholderia cepacia]|uniref:DUF5677 domain-containing protein n=1 Tax=Burkholderia cepacia TaxID=292 RepID=UPI002AB5FFB5|nr:DUF5677 domain-containing protein [Burkholderia cepacia]
MIEEEGFLSRDMDGYIAAIREDFAEEIRQCRAISCEATTQLFKSGVDATSVPEVMAASFWTRCLTACQATIVLGERGLNIEGLALLRTAYEYLFFCAAIANNPACIARIEAQDRTERIKQAEKLQKSEIVRQALSEEDCALLDGFVRDTPKTKKQFSAFDAARLGGMEGLYESAYRTLSLVGTHASYTTGGHAFGSSLADMRFGPSKEHLAMLFGLTRDCIGLGIQTMTPLLKCKPQESGE